MVSLVDLVELSNASYASTGDASFDHEGRNRRWRRTTSWSNPVGYYAALFENERRERVLAFRGSDDGFDWAVDDAMIAAGQVPPQLIAAIVSSQGLENVSFVTGHSLGGALALLVGARRNLRAVTFNAPGVLDSCLHSAVLQLSPSTGGRCVSGRGAINFRINGDPVSSAFATGAQVGPTVTLPGSQCGALDIGCRHGMQTCIDAVRRYPASFQPLS